MTSSRFAVIATLVLCAASISASQVNITFKAGTSQAERDRALVQVGATKLSRIDCLNVVTACVPNGAAERALAGNPNVVALEEDAIAQASSFDETAARGKPQPPPPPDETVPTGVDRIDAEPALSGNAGAGVIVAIIDTGIDLSHPDLSANLVSGYNFVRQGSLPQDDNGHGSHVAGTVAAVHNTIGVVGVASQAKLMPLKALNRNGSGTYSAIAAAITWAADNGAQVISMSLGGPSFSSTLQNAVTYAAGKGIQIVCAAGNDGPAPSGGSTVGYPAKYAECIAVSAWCDSNGASDSTGPTTSYGADETLASFSSTGPEVDIAAPGVNIRSTWLGGGYNTISGTSMATPHVSGVLARIINANGSTNARTILTTQYVEAVNGTPDQVGAGLVHGSVVVP